MKGVEYGGNTLQHIGIEINATSIEGGVMSEETRRISNKDAAKLCMGCVHLHIGTEVDHKTREAWNWMEARVNGQWFGGCHYKLLKEVEEAIGEKVRRYDNKGAPID